MIAEEGKHVSFSTVNAVEEPLPDFMESPTNEPRMVHYKLSVLMQCKHLTRRSHRTED